MPTTPSPLRYPGGKTSTYKMMSKIIYGNDLNGGIYAEPYAGGCGLALSLLFNNVVREIYLNDIDPSIWCFWDSIINETDRFISKIIDTEVSTQEWHRQKGIQNNKENESKFELGFSTFFLNRTNRSGVIQKAGMIGGYEQKGNYKLDCRFNKKMLIKKIERIKKYSHRIKLFNLDAIEFFKLTDAEVKTDGLYCIDPPYYQKGATLYTNFYCHDDHELVCNSISSLKSPWILTYDNAQQIKELYKRFMMYNFNLNYSAADKKIGTELMVTSKDISISSEMSLNKVA